MTKKELTPEQKARSAQVSRVLTELIGDTQLKLAYSFLFTLATWGGLSGGWGIHVPFLPVWLLTMTGLMFTRHMSRTIARGAEKGKFEATYQNFLNFAANGTPAPEAPVEPVGSFFQHHRNDGSDGPYL
jgi:hypothetical protein